jgi:predicted DNA-binding transcriptional regulator YafY
MYDPSMRVLTVLELLQSRERVSGQELAGELEVSVRTVQRYVMRLQDLGVPVESTRGPGGAYRLAPGFRMPPLMLGTEEAFAIALGLDALAHLGLSEVAPAAVGARTKLQRVLPLAVGARIAAVRDTLLLEEPRMLKSADMALLLQLAIATNGLQRVWMSYQSDSGERTERAVEPLGLMQYEGRWFLAAWCLLRNDFRLFRVDRIGEAELLQEHFERPDTFDLRAFVYQRLAMAEAPWRIEVWVDLPPDEVEPRLPRAVALYSEEAGGTLLRSTATDLEHFALMLMRLGGAIEIRQPNELRDAFRALAARAMGIAKQ